MGVVRLLAALAKSKMVVEEVQGLRVRPDYFQDPPPHTSMHRPNPVGIPLRASARTTKIKPHACGVDHIARSHESTEKRAYVADGGSR